MKTISFVAFMALGLMGCAFQSGIVAASDDSIDIKAGQYTNPGADAAEHCAQYGKEAKLMNVTPMQSVYSLYRYKCVEPD